MDQESQSQQPGKPKPPGASGSSGPGPSGWKSKLDGSVPLKLVLAGVGALVILGLTFWAGMAYQSHRVSSALEDAFGDFDSEASGDDFFEEDTEAEEVDPVELIEGEPQVVKLDEDGDGEDDGEYTITLLKTVPKDEPGASETLDRALDYFVKVENTGETPVDVSLSGHYETDEGEVLEFAGVFCDEDDLPEDTVKPGQFVQGCKSHDLPDAAGRLVFDEGGSPLFYISVPSA